MLTVYRHKQVIRKLCQVVFFAIQRSTVVHCYQAEAATGGVLLRKVFLKISEKLQENTCARVSFLIKLQVSGLQLYLKKDCDTGFSREFFKISKDTFFTEYILVTASDSTIFYRKD